MPTLIAMHGKQRLPRGAEHPVTGGMEAEAGQSVARELSMDK